MTITGPEMAEWSDALISAYNLEELIQLLKFRLDKDLRRITSTQLDYETIVFNLLEKASRFGWEMALLQAARQSNSSNPQLYKLCQQYGLAVETPSTAQLEKIIRKSSKFKDVAAWREMLGQLETRVCRVEIAGEPEGTGFLVGPAAILTNYHVIKDVHEGQVKVSDLTIRFDYKVLSSGEITDGTVFHVLKGDQWLGAWSSYSSVDSQPEPKSGMPSEDELDYALLCLDTAAGKLPIGENPNPGAHPRGWINLPERVYTFSPKSPLHILQHPKGEPLKLSLDTEAVVGLNANGTRVKYMTNTEPGSSGSPCFDDDWNLIALHHSGEPNKFPLFLRASYNEGIPIEKIIKSLRLKGVMDIVRPIAG